MKIDRTNLIPCFGKHFMCTANDVALNVDVVSPGYRKPILDELPQ